MCNNTSKERELSKGHINASITQASYSVSIPLVLLHRWLGDRKGISLSILSRAKLQSNHHHQQTNIQFLLQTRCPSCHPTNSVEALKGKISHSMDLLTPSSPGVFQLYLTCKISHISNLQKVFFGRPTGTWPNLERYPEKCRINKC